MDRRWKARVLVLCSLVLATGAWADLETIDTGLGNSFTLQFENDNYDPFDNCDGVTPGGTTLDPLGYLDLGAATNNTLSASILASLESQYGSRNYMTGQLDYQYKLASSHLTGTMYIDWYKAFDREVMSAGVETCLHGAEIVAYYDYGTGEDALNLDWVQSYYEYGDSDYAPTDTYQVDGTGDNEPGYYASTQSPWTPPGHGGLEAGHSLTWSDGPQDPHPEATGWDGSVDFFLTLASFGAITANGADMWVQEVIIYDGITWGYTGECTIVPEPATILLLGMSLAGIAARRRAIQPCAPGH